MPKFLSKEPKKSKVVKEKATTSVDDSQDESPKSPTILDSISLDVPSGQFMAIIGGSGSGKTSLLNALSQRVKSSNIATKGNIYYNGQPNLSHVTHAFVLQQDILEPNLTCRETLKYAADLRLSDASKEYRYNIVEEIILELGLKECADTMVGDSSRRGLSGGEKRRLSMGIQLLANPSVLFLDEPTTGLDASSAYLLTKTCYNLARMGRTVIMSIHQPRSDIFFLFDIVTVLATGGRLTYTGSVDNVVPYFESLGHYLPLRVNPADFIIDICAIDSRTSEAESRTRERVAKLVDSWNAYHKFDNAPLLGITDINNSKHEKKQRKVPLLREITVLTKRQFVMSYRDPMGYAGLLFEAISMGIIVGWVFYKMDGSIRGIRSQQGALYTACALQGYLLLLYEIYRLCRIDLKIYDRERGEGCITVHGYLISRRLAKVFTEDLFVPLIFSVISYFMMGLTRTATQFFIYFAVCLIGHYISITFATCCAAISREFAMASLIGNLFYTLQSMACGFFANSSHLPVYVRWTHWATYLYYSLIAVIENQFQGYFGDCPYGNQNTPECLPYTGEYVITSMNFRLNWISTCIGIITAWAVGFYLAAWVILYLFPMEISMAQGPKHTGHAKSNPEVFEFQKTENPNPLVVELKDLKLTLEKSFFGYKKQNISILNGISARFYPGSINAILGPSGSGKSSLLNLVADRLNSSVFSKYHSNDAIFFNNVAPPREVISSLCSFVTQEDDGLLPSLTVRETLHYAAYLRLPSHLKHEERRQIADNIILKMGLKYCANTPIGDELVKGISGGEKRRVTISIQLLNDPKVLLLDEPTSGLDSFTATSILEVLKSLAAEGRTVICTIHQPRSDMFNSFGNILLLAKGGRSAFNGSPEYLFGYLDRIGYPCPSMTNPADHLLDLISINLQTAQKEELSRERVRTILESWQEENQRLEQEASEKSNNQQLSSLQLIENEELKKRQKNVFSAYTVLLSRSWKNLKRSPHLLAARIGQVIGIGGILALFFSPFRDDYIGIMNRLGMLQQITALYFVGMLNNISVYPSERSVFYREYDDGIYDVLPFFMSYTTIELPFEFMTAMIFSVLYAIASGLDRSVAMFFITTYAVIVIVNCGESLGIIFNTLFLHEGFAINVISVILSIGTIMAGLMSLNMPGFLRGINWISPLKFAVGVVTQQSMQGQKFTCGGQVVDPETGECPLMTGEQVLQVYGVDIPIKPYLGALAVCLVVYRLIAFIVLRINRLKLKIHKLI